MAAQWSPKPSIKVRILFLLLCTSGGTGIRTRFKPLRPLRLRVQIPPGVFLLYEFAVEQSPAATRCVLKGIWFDSSGQRSAAVSLIEQGSSLENYQQLIFRCLGSNPSGGVWTLNGVLFFQQKNSPKWRVFLLIINIQSFPLTGGPHRRCYSWVVSAADTSPFPQRCLIRSRRAVDLWSIHWYLCFPG